MRSHLMWTHLEKLRSAVNLSSGALTTVAATTRNLSRDQSLGELNFNPSWHINRKIEPALKKGPTFWLTHPNSLL